MIRTLLVPSSDYLGHPFPQRHNQIFEKLHDGKNFEVHVARFKLFEKPKLKTNLIIHELSGDSAKSVRGYYLKGMINHAFEIRQLIRREAIDVVVLSNLSAPFSFTLLEKLSSMNIPVVFDLPDYYPTSAAGYLCDVNSVKGSLLVGSFDFMLRRILRNSTVITTPSSTLVNYARQAGAKNVVLLPNGVSESFLLSPCNGDNVRKKIGFSKDDFVAGYIGSVEFWLDFKCLIKGVSLAKKQGLPIKLLLVGKGLYTDYAKKVMQWIKQENLEKETSSLGFVPYSEVPEYISAMDVGLIPFDVLNPTAFYSAPNKMWEYLSQMKPVISTSIPESLLNSSSLSIASTPAEYAKHFFSIAQKDQEITDKVNFGYKEAHTKTWENSSIAFGNLLRNLVKETDLVEFNCTLDDESNPYPLSIFERITAGLRNR